MIKVIDAFNNNAAKSLENELKTILGEELNKLCIICTGTDRWTGDSLGPIVGERLEAIKHKNISIVGTLKKPLQGEEVKSVISVYRQKGYKILVIDSALGTVNDIYNLIISNDEILLGRAINKGIKIKPDVSIRAVVNRAGFMDQETLQNTRLYHVMRLSKPIIEGVTNYCLAAGANTLI